MLALYALYSTHVSAQEVRATNPLFVTPVSELKPDQVAQMQQRLLDWPQLQRYRGENAALVPVAPGTKRVVFYGDSITEGWGPTGSERFFPGKPYVNRGISGQTTAQMLLRFQQDVIALKPALVVILAGTNDIAGNTGPTTQAMIEDNLHAMVELAQAHNIRIVLASVLPVSDYPWQPGVQPAGKVTALNRALRAYAEEQGLVYLDYYTAMTNKDGGLDPELAADGVHPTPAGYAKMVPLAEAAIARAQGR
ncbi:SGNH/GDSL hydrolase family protein [Stenotrophomonas sp. TWI700]|uniref:SGNH/GDSL hydrolase family protein n=1 Tax=Stenotrophomonas sp. TWI700 TaxID=3136792 RepID=UPI003209B29D